MSIIKEFKEFAMRGNVMDMAVGVIIGGAFGKIVSSFINDILMPPLGLLLGNADFSDLVITLRAGTEGIPPVVLSYGKFATAVTDFLIIAFAIFIMVRVMNRLKRSDPPVSPTEKKCPECQMTIPLEARRCGHCAQPLPL
ncbi:MAG TPA: large-conductance mechanosensitive channel protein MscL [Elusimicrobiota bacterium]|nr:large-conductance mechanosensitive channel protein MscL [Elusimicrobiota bacterium]